MFFVACTVPFPGPVRHPGTRRAGPQYGTGSEIHMLYPYPSDPYPPYPSSDPRPVIFLGLKNKGRVA
jgi:hypothetical protein